MHEHSPPGSVFVLDLAGLLGDDVTVWSVWKGDGITAIGALRTLGDGSAELKSMRANPDFLRQGAAAPLLDFIIDEPGRRGVRRISLETGSGNAFERALALYRRRRFSNGKSFGAYVQSDFNQFLHLSILERFQVGRWYPAA